LKWFRVALTTIFVFVLSPAIAQQTEVGPVLTSADTRPSLGLDGPWNWSVDPFRDGEGGFLGGEAGQSHRRYEEIDTTARMKADNQALYEYDMEHSPVAQLPQSFVTFSPEMRYYNGLVWLQRHFTTHRQPGKRAFLRFGAVDYRATVYLNGKLVGKHEGGFTPFAFDVTKLIRDGDNQLTVGADSERTASDVPPVVTDWDNYGGITRPVLLIFTPETFVDDEWVRLTRDGHIAATVKLDGPVFANAPVAVRIPALGLTLSGRTGADGSWTGEAAAPRSLRRWSPESPTLYEVQVSGGGDIVNDRVGFRTIEVRGTDIFLNGKPIFLRGIDIHAEEFGENPTRDITPQAARALLTEAKQGLHANFVRLAHYPHPETMLRAADELGLLVWSEIPVYWQVDFANPKTLETALHMQTESILRDRNRASIIIWSVGNETPTNDARNVFLRTLVANARHLDDTRLVSAALLSGRKGDIQTIDDPLGADLDVLAVNTYNGWYTPDPLSKVPDIQWRSIYNKPLIFSELGAGALAGYHDDPANPHKFSEEFQADYYRATLKMISKIPFLRGISPWILKDFRSPRRQHPIYQQGWNRKGLESPTGVHKEAFGVLADYYRSLEERR
jgi:beta-glucuronidase